MQSLFKRFGVALLAFLFHLNNIEKPHLVNTQGRSFEHATVTEILRDNLQENGSRIGDQIVRLHFADDTESEANCPNGLLFGTVCKPGMTVNAMRSQAGALASCTVYSYDRSKAVIGFLVFFCTLLILIGGSKGLKSVLALFLTFASFLFFFFPLLMHGVAPILAAVITATIILSLTVWLICGQTKKALAAGIASFGGVLAAGLSAEIFGAMAQLSGYNVTNIEALLFVAQSTRIDVGGLLFAGILFASLGAVLDIAMDVSAAVAEVAEAHPASSRELFASGMRVGQDVMGTMAATLILAVFGGSLGTWVLDYVYDLPLLQLVNSNGLDIVIMQVSQAASASSSPCRSPRSALRGCFLVKRLELLARESVAFPAEMADDLRLAVLDERLEVSEPEAQQHLADALLRAGAAEGEVGCRKIVDLEPLEERRDDPPRVESLLDQMRDGLYMAEVLLEPFDRLLRRIRQRLEQETAGTNAVEVRIDEHAEADARRRLLGVVEILCQIVGDLTVRERRAARHGVAQSRETRDCHHAVRADAAADVDLAFRIQRQIDMRIADRAAHEAFRHSVRRHLAEGAVTIERDGHGLFVLEVRREEQRARHRPAERSGRHGIAVMAADGLIDEVGRHGGVDAHAIRHRLYEMILHIFISLSKEPLIYS